VKLQLQKVSFNKDMISKTSAGSHKSTVVTSKTQHTELNETLAVMLSLSNTV